MKLLPAATNDDYRGSVAAAYFLFALGVLTVVPGCIHAFLPDGGAVVIAGLDLGSSAATIIGVFAWAGATQIVHGLAMIAVAVWYRSLVPLFLFLVLVERSVMSVNWWVLKPSPGHALHTRPPEVYVTLALLPVLVFFLVRSLAPSPAPSASRGVA